MNSRKIGVLILILLVIVTISGAVTIGIRYNRETPVRISIHRPETQTGNIYISGAVNSPGILSYKPEDTIQSLIQAAGGTVNSANLSSLELHVSGNGQTLQSQKVDINNADAWLLEALPGIGSTLAQHIIEYRQKNGQFHNINELLNVPGIGATTFNRLKDLITVKD
jgi:competence protein ComEA